MSEENTVQAPVETEQDAPAGADESRVKANKILDKCVSALRRGESGLSSSRLECGRYAREYTGARLGAGEKREQAITQLVAELGRWSSEQVNGVWINSLMRASAAYDLLACEGELTDSKEDKDWLKKIKGIPWSSWRDHYARLVERTETGGAESYALLPGAEDDCRAAFTTSTSEGLSGAAVHDKVHPLVGIWNRSQQDAKRAAAEKLAADRAAAEAEASRLAKQGKDAEKTLRAAENAARLAKDAKDAAATAATTDAMHRAKEELLATQRAALAKVEESERLDRERKVLERASAAHGKQADKVEGKPAAKPAAPRREKGADSNHANLLDRYKDASPKDIGAFAAQLLLRCQDRAAALKVMFGLLLADKDPEESVELALAWLTNDEKKIGLYMRLAMESGIEMEWADADAPEPETDVNEEEEEMVVAV